MEKTYTEDELVQLYQEGRIGMKDYVTKRSCEWKEEYEAFCREQNLPEDDYSAEAFMDLKGRELEKAVEEGEA